MTNFLIETNLIEFIINTYYKFEKNNKKSDEEKEYGVDDYSGSESEIEYDVDNSVSSSSGTEYDLEDDVDNYSESDDEKEDIEAKEFSDNLEIEKINDEKVSEYIIECASGWGFFRELSENKIDAFKKLINSWFILKRYQSDKTVLKSMFRVHILYSSTTIPEHFESKTCWATVLYPRLREARLMIIAGTEEIRDKDGNIEIIRLKDAIIKYINNYVIEENFLNELSIEHKSEKEQKEQIDRFNNTVKNLFLLDCYSYYTKNLESVYMKNDKTLLHETLDSILFRILDKIEKGTEEIESSEHLDNFLENNNWNISFKKAKKEMSTFLFVGEMTTYIINRAARQGYLFNLKGARVDMFILYINYWFSADYYKFFSEALEILFLTDDKNLINKMLDRCIVLALTDLQPLQGKIKKKVDLIMNYMREKGELEGFTRKQVYYLKENMLTKWFIFESIDYWDKYRYEFSPSGDYTENEAIIMEEILKPLQKLYVIKDGALCITDDKAKIDKILKPIASRILRKLRKEIKNREKEEKRQINKKQQQFVISHAIKKGYFDYFDEDQIIKFKDIINDIFTYEYYNSLKQDLEDVYKIHLCIQKDNEFSYANSSNTKVNQTVTADLRPILRQISEQVWKWEELSDAHQWFLTYAKEKKYFDEYNLTFADVIEFENIVSDWFLLNHEFYKGALETIYKSDGEFEEQFSLEIIINVTISNMIKDKKEKWKKAHE